jgi:hypothetical protein
MNYEHEANYLAVDTPERLIWKKKMFSIEPPMPMVKVRGEADDRLVKSLITVLNGRFVPTEP